jgi:hypothetical protein
MSLDVNFTEEISVFAWLSGQPIRVSEAYIPGDLRPLVSAIVEISYILALLRFVEKNE